MPVGEIVLPEIDGHVSALAWAVSHHTDASRNPKATLKCCYALCSYVGVVDRLYIALFSALEQTCCAHM